MIDTAIEKDEPGNSPEDEILDQLRNDAERNERLGCDSPSTYSQVFGVPDAYRDLHDATVEAIAQMLEGLPVSVLSGLCARLGLIPLIEDVDELFPTQD